MAETLCGVILTSFLCSCSAVSALLLYRGVRNIVQRRFSPARVVRMPEDFRERADFTPQRTKASEPYTSVRCRVIPFPRNASSR